MTVVLVHGFPETARIWDPLRAVLGRESVALSLPGFGASRPDGFTATKDAYAGWLADTLRALEGPIDLVGHDVGALLTLRVASATEVELRSYVVDVADIFHPNHVWPERVFRSQPTSVAQRLEGVGVPPDLAREIESEYDDVMRRSILDFYRSAAPNVAADWWGDARSTRARGLVLLLPDPPEIEAMALEVAERLGAETAWVGDLGHCWMAQAPEVVAPVLDRFWA